MKPTPLLLEECFVNSKIAATPDAGIPLSEACQLDPDQPEAYDFSAMLATLNVLTFIPSSPQNGFLAGYVYHEVWFYIQEFLC